jgi:hypothetical protein
MLSTNDASNREPEPDEQGQDDLLTVIEGIMEGRGRFVHLAVDPCECRQCRRQREERTAND